MKPDVSLPFVPRNGKGFVPVRGTVLIVDTESSVRDDLRTRVLVSLAYEAVQPETDDGCGVCGSGYDIVRHPPGSPPPDLASLRIHGIDAATSRRHGRSLRDVLVRFGRFVHAFPPVAIVGHDIQRDVALLVSECVRVGLPPAKIFGEGTCRLFCTKLGATAHCAIPLPARHLASGSPPYKWPRLSECYRRLVVDAGIDPGDEYPCHDARGDVARCRAVFASLTAKHYAEWPAPAFLRTIPGTAAGRCAPPVAASPRRRNGTTPASPHP